MNTARRQKAEGRRQDDGRRSGICRYCLPPSAFCFLVVAFCLLSVGRAADDEPKAAAAPQEFEITERVEKSVEKACQWLAKNQDRNGGLKSSYSCAATGLAGLAWLASGSTPNDGPYSKNINLAIEFVLKSAARNGFISEGGGVGPSGMYGHGYSTQFLAEVCGMIRDPEQAARVRDVLEKAVRSIEGCQNQFGGWNSSPNGALSDDGSGAIAVMQVTALRAAESCGINVRQQVISKAKKYLLDMTNDQGWYAYNWHSRGSSSNGSIATTGAGMYMLGALNLQNDPKYAKGIKNIMNSMPRSGNDAAMGGWQAYSIFYASLAIFQHGGNEWQRWYKTTADMLIKTQSSDGGWNDQYSGVFVALSVLSLELPYRYLPLFQEGGAGMEGK